MKFKLGVVLAMVLVMLISTNIKADGNDDYYQMKPYGAETFEPMVVADADAVEVGFSHRLLKESVKDLGRVVEGETIPIKGVDTKLFMRFQDYPKAAENANTVLKKIVDFLKDNEALAQDFIITTENVMTLKDAYYGNLEEIYQLFDFDDSYRFEAFLTLAECFIRNDTIRRLELEASIQNKSGKSLKSDYEMKDDEERLLGLLPMTSALYKGGDLDQVIAKNGFRSLSNGSVPASNFSPSEKEKAIAYAKNHATNRNLDYVSFNADCTNFLSQIFEAGGRQQAVRERRDEGWWHKRSGGPNSSVTTSYTWSFTGNFGRYWGYTDWYEKFPFQVLAKDAEAGDVLYLDKMNTGFINHLAFVAEVGTESTYKGMVFKDMVIAEHTPDALSWISEKDNKWVEYIRNGGIIGFISK